MSNSTLTLFGENVAVQMVEEAVEGKITLPQNKHVRHELGRVMTVGDGKYRTGENRTMWVKPGDIIMYQLGGPQISNAAYKLDDAPIRVFHQGDAIARLKINKITMENIQILGDWVLLRVETQKGLIVIPDQHVPPENFKFYLEQVGEGFKLNIAIGEEVMPERGRCAPMDINGKTYVYTHQDFLRGVVRPSAAAPVAAP
jgi:co-chaperonin GroES (HSP10)